jgi:hypothetical protein
MQFKVVLSGIVLFSSLNAHAYSWPSQHPVDVSACAQAIHIAISEASAHGIERLQNNPAYQGAVKALSEFTASEIVLVLSSRENGMCRYKFSNGVEATGIISKQESRGYEDGAAKLYLWDRLLLNFKSEGFDYLMFFPMLKSESTGGLEIENTHRTISTPVDGVVVRIGSMKYSANYR